ncbi:hypothetical protein WJ542_29110 [Paraburkholderia sp. B3]|uniref:hypothetical protein n=1 Tax=Paraburkholderia sp. B3 TaxID=3134791 RepID=UPI00398198B4
MLLPQFLLNYWRSGSERIKRYIGVPPNYIQFEPSSELLCCEALGAIARFAHGSHLDWLPGVFQIDVEDPRDIAAMTRVATPTIGRHGATRSRMEGNQTSASRDAIGFNLEGVVHRTPATAIVERSDRSQL